DVDLEGKSNSLAIYNTHLDFGLDVSMVRFNAEGSSLENTNNILTINNVRVTEAISVFMGNGSNSLRMTNVLMSNPFPSDGTGINVGMGDGINNALFINVASAADFGLITGSGKNSVVMNHVTAGTAGSG